MVWQQELETKLDGGVVSLSVLADSCELLAGTQEGSVYRLLLADLSASKVSEMQRLSGGCIVAPGYQFRYAQAPRFLQYLLCLIRLIAPLAEIRNQGLARTPCCRTDGFPAILGIILRRTCNSRERRMERVTTVKSCERMLQHSYTSFRLVCWYLQGQLNYASNNFAAGSAASKTESS